jgi:hypothetical protein
MAENRQEDLDWQAFRYIAAEMPPGEVARFEEQLCGNQPSREAVARAVELAEAVAVVSADFPADDAGPKVQPAGRVASAWWSRIGWFGVGVAATLACVIVLQGFNREVTVAKDPLPAAPSSAAVDPNAAQFALLWCQMRDEIAQTGNVSWPPELITAPIGEPAGLVPEAPDAAQTRGPVEADGDAPMEETDSMVAVPSWMLAAVAGELGLGGDNGPPKQED